MFNKTNVEYFKNTFILFLGKISTQFISFLLLPLYTHYFIAKDYGYIDLLQTYISLIVPILLLRLDSAVFRFLIDERKKDESNNRKIIITSSLVMVLIISLLFLFISLILRYFISVKYSFLITINSIVIMFSSLVLQIIRGLGKNKLYSISSIITGVITLITSFLLIVVIKYDARSILISSIIANGFCIFIVFFNSKMYKYLDIKNINFKKLKEMLVYSIPMIPNGLSWWIVNVSDRTIISTLIGAASNGIYSVSCKFSNIINNFFSVFNMSWQESASIYINDDNKEAIFNDIINKVMKIFNYMSVLVLIGVSLLYQYIIGIEYLEAYKYIPILLVSNIINVLAQLLGAIYIAKKLSNKIMNTTIFASIVNIIINILLIKAIGLYAACVSTLISYIIVAFYRFIDVQKYVKVKLNLSTILEIIFINSIVIITYYVKELYLNIIVLIFIIIYIIFFNKSLINETIILLLGKRKKTK